MPLTIQSPPAYPRLHHHPLASAFLAISAATLLVLGVQGYTAWNNDVVLAGDTEEAPADDPPASEPLDTH
ncbi:MAG: hypothetical protein P1V81_05715 [Planctomycetota bacterium]|nr:hypothetical protein [Planctomycetota bacterium]